MAQNIKIKSWSKKKRLQKALSLLTSGDQWVYDLYCDHGDLGKACLNEGKNVLFNDISPRLVQGIREDLGVQMTGKAPLVEYWDRPAQELKFKESSLIFMLGVGGLLMIDCLKAWEFNETQRFVAIPAYYSVELYEYLASLEGFELSLDFVKEGRRGYEVFIFKKVSHCQPNFQDYFEADSWKERGIDYIRRRFHSLRNKRQRTQREEFLVNELRKIIEKY